MHKYANPTVFMGLANAVLPWAVVAAVVLFLAGLPMALVISPPDYQQGETVRIFYVHVPAAMMGMMIYVIMGLNSAAFLIWRHPIASLIARASAPLGAMFTAVGLIGGALWGKPMWGTYWTWDARLTSFLILLFLYGGYMALADAFEDSERGDKAAAVLALVGLVNVPIIHFSVDWWNTLHQPSILTMKGFTVDAAMLWPFFLMFGAFLAFYVCMLVLRLRIEILNVKIRNARRARATEPLTTSATQQV